MKKYAYLLINVFALFVIISPEDDKTKLKFLKFSFNRNITLKDSSPEEFYKTNFYNQIYVNMEIGSEKIKIPFYLYLKQYSLQIQSANSKDRQVKGLFDESKDNKYTNISSIKLDYNKQSYDGDDLAEGIISKDIFYFDNDQNSIIQFILSIQNFPSSHITVGGKIGFDITSESIKDNNLSFVRFLKNNKIISSDCFSILYDSPEFNCDKGVLYIGASPHQIDNQRYKETDYNKTYSDGYEWEFQNFRAFFGNKGSQSGLSVDLYPEFGLIIGNQKYFEVLNNSGQWFEYFNKNEKCHQYEFQIDDFEYYESFKFSSKYTGYYCNKDLDIDKLVPENITFSDNDLKINFTLNNKDIWVEKGEYKYFLILSSLNLQQSWILGAPFFKKFHMNFNLGSKEIGVYTSVNFNSENTPGSYNTFVLYIIIISILIILCGVLSFFLIRIYAYLPRKKRANELLDEDYEYNPQGNEKNTKNEIIPNEEEN